MSFLEFVKWCIGTHPDGFGALTMVFVVIGLPMFALMWHSMWDAIGRRK